MSTAVLEKTNEQPRVSGVQELINRMRTEGVSKGQEESDRLVAEARRDSMQILDDAKREAGAIRSAARAEAEHLRKNAEDALRLAARDAVLALNEAIRSDFVAKVRRLVSHTMQDRSFLERLILEVARRAIPDDAGKSVEVLLPADVITYEELKRNPQELAENSLSRFVLQLSGDVLREGLTFAPAEDERPGLRVQLKDEDVEIDLTDQALTDLLMEHLSPRFRALMDHPQS
jgi:V/A-type H+/Na+-transporting ATPase subunit E